MLKRKIFYLFKLLSVKRLTTVAGAWVYYFLISAVPLAFLFITAFGVFGVDVAEQIVSRLPLEFRSAGQAIVNTAKNVSDSITVFFVGTVIFSGTTLLNQMSKDGDYIYASLSKSKRGLLRRVWAVMALVALYLFFLVLAVFFVFGNAINVGKVFIGRSSILLTVTAFLFIIISSYLVIIVLNKFICPFKLSFYQTAIGSLVSLFVMVIGTIIFIIYIRFFASYNAFYGSLAGVIIFLLWTYILMLGLVLGAIINSELAKKSRGKKYVKNSKFHKTLRTISCGRRPFTSR